MLRFGVRSPDIDRTRRMLMHIPGAAEKAISRAVNKAIATAQTEAIRRAKQRYAIGDADLRKGIKIVRATANRPTATLIATSALHRVYKFKISKGAIAKSEIVRGNVKAWPHAFIAKMKSGHVGLFKRLRDRFSAPESGRYAKTKEREATRGVSRGPVGARLKREKVEEVASVSTAEMIGHYEIIEEILEIAEGKLEDELNRQVELFLTGKVK